MNLIWEKYSPDISPLDLCIVWTTLSTGGHQCGCVILQHTYYYTPVLYSPDLTMGSNEKKIREENQGNNNCIVPWFCGPDFLHSCHDVKCYDPGFYVVVMTSHAVMSWHSYTHIKQIKNVYLSPTLLTDFGMEAEGNHFNNMISLIRRKLKYIYFLNLQSLGPGGWTSGHSLMSGQ